MLIQTEFLLIRASSDAFDEAQRNNFCTAYSKVFVKLKGHMRPFGSESLTSY
jgi:hypothetical protein